MDTTDEPIPRLPTRGPEWLPPAHLNQYLNYLQEFTHNINLLRWFLSAGDNVSVRAVDLDNDGYTGVVIFDMAGKRAVLETGDLSHYRYDEHMQIYYRHGWVKVMGPALLLKQTCAEVEIYRAGDEQSFIHPLPRPAWTWSYKREAEHFIRCLQTGETVHSSAADTYTNVRLFEEIYRIHLAQRALL
jgi:predicted dehydrogenase